MPTLLQWNLNSAIQKRAELRKLIRDHDPFAITLQETQLTQRHMYNIKGYQIHRKDFLEGNRACNGVAILVKDCYQHKLLPLNTNLQAVAI